jgi:hypothetical protein
MAEDTKILTTHLKHIPSGMSADDIEQLLPDIPGNVHLWWFQPGECRTLQAAVAARDLPPLDVGAANVISQCILQKHFSQHDVDSIEVKDLIQRVAEGPE